ncbi:MAG TPA: hypothetical protein VFB73_11355 [Chloroflexota bacterium]|nr:hypothetical protein [Chloroflexota bacterium]
MEETGPVACYNVSAGTLHVQLAGGEELTVSGLGPDLVLYRQDDAETLQLPLWLSAQQADVLGKAIEYILRHVRISPAAQQILAALAPEVQQLKGRLDRAGASLE